MEVYTLDSLLRRREVFDDFESLIWTERYLPWGDFELKMRPTPTARNLLKEGTLLATNKSLYIGEIENITDEVNENGVKVLTFKGRTIEKILEDRTAADSLGATANWEIAGLPADVARYIFHEICVAGRLSEFDVIPFINEGPIVPESTIPEPIDPIIWSQPPQSAYKAIAELCAAWNLGFRILRNFDTSELYFDVYSGTDRTTRQTLMRPVIFSPELDNLQNTSELRTNEDAKNVANVFTPAGFLEVFALSVDPEIEGFERRVLTVVADDIAADNPDWEAAALQRGKEELSKHRAFQAFDGEISQSSQYVYGRDYYLGDIVEQRNSTGVSNDMRVTEQIFVHDKEGERSYPTLTLNEFVNTGSWLSWETSKKWIDYDDDFDTVWASLP